MAEPTKWSCPKCKADNGPEFTNCRMCGEHNPDRPVVQTCEKCGFKTDQSCCPSCNSPMFLQL